MKRFLCFSTLAVAALLPLVMAEAQPPVPEQPEVLYTPDSSVKFALQDLQAVPVEFQPYIRYLSLYNVPKKWRAAWGRTISFVCNSLSTRKKMYIPEFVGGSDQTVIRINIYSYDWPKDCFDNLAKKGSGPKARPDPYFHALLEKLVDVDEYEEKPVTKTKQVPAGTDQYGRTIFKAQEVTTTEKVKVGPQKKRILAGAGWVDPNNLAALIRLTGSEAPILRGDWFVVNVTLPPAYYDFLKLGKTQKDFENLIFADEEKAKKARSQDKGVVVVSGVARNNRTLNRSPTFTSGYYWQSHDSLTSVDDRQYVQNLLDEKFDATEDIGTLPNGLQAYFLTDGKGNRLDKADPDIAIDNTAVDRVVRTGRSCIICHGSGILPLEDEVRTLTRQLQNREQIKLLVTREKDIYRIEDLFSSELDGRIAKDQQIYVDAVAACNGMTSDANARQYGKFYDEYAEHLMTKETIFREVGVVPSEMEKYIRMSQDNVILGLVKNPIRPVRRDQWERSFQDFMLLITAAKSAK